MAVLGLDYQTALWDFPAGLGMKLQIAYLERQGTEQDWGRSELDKLIQAMSNGSC